MMKDNLLLQLRELRDLSRQLNPYSDPLYEEKYDALWQDSYDLINQLTDGDPVLCYLRDFYPSVYYYTFCYWIKGDHFSGNKLSALCYCLIGEIFNWVHVTYDGMTFDDAKR